MAFSGMGLIVLECGFIRVGVESVVCLMMGLDLVDSRWGCWGGVECLMLGMLGGVRDWAEGEALS